MAKRKSPKERKEERKKEKQRGQQTIIIGAVILIAAFAAIVFAVTSLPTEAPIPEDIIRYDDFMTGTTQEGYPILGNPAAPVTVREYSSFACPGCLDFHSTVFPQLLPLIAEGQIQFIFVPLQTGSIPNQEGAARTAVCAGEQGQFWQMHDVLFSWHETYGNSAFQNGRIRTGVAEMGLDSGAFNRCFDSNATNTILTAALNESVASTPSIEVNNVLVSSPTWDAITNAINIPPGTQYDSGLIDGGVDAGVDIEATESVDSEATEAMDDMEADSEATEEAMDDMEATEEAMDDMEATEEAEATEASE